jgi:hypothetical protein
MFYIGHWFVAALAYADDILLLAPTPRALRRMLSICENFAAEYNVTFNCNKSKSINMHAHKYIRTGKSDPTFAINGKTIENVDTWSHLGHLFNASVTDDDDIMARRKSFVGQANSFFCYFSMLTAPLRKMLFKVYCGSHYGCELWDLTSNKLEEYCIAWRKSIRKIWCLPYTTSRVNVSLLAGSVPIFDEICRRSTNFIHSCLNSSANLTRHGILFAGTKSPVGRNALFCSRRYGINVADIGRQYINSKFFFNCFVNSLSDESLLHADVFHELLMVRDGVAHFSNSAFAVNDANELIRLLSVH